MKFDDPNYNNINNSCDFLDVTIAIADGQINTDLFRKDTAKPRTLSPRSAHPMHIPTNIIYSMGFRLLRICSSEALFEKRLLELKTETTKLLKKLQR